MKNLIPIILLLLSFFTLWGNGKNEQNFPPIQVTPIPSLIYLEGEVTINGKAGEEGQEISVGSTLETGIDSYCEVLFAGKNIIRIQEETITTLNIGQNQGKIQLEKGTMALLLEKLDVLGLGNKDFEVTTPITTAGIRGTAFFIKVESPDSVYFCNCNGIINLTDIEGGNKQILTAEQHKAVRYVKTENTISQSDAALLYHSDKDMDELAAKIDHKIPWGKVGYGSNY